MADCLLCGEPVVGRRRTAKYCSSQCQLIAKKRRHAYAHRLGEGMECPHCHKVCLRQARNQKYCSKECTRAAERQRLGVRKSKGEKMTCLICKKEIVRLGVNQLFCHERCEGEVACVCCQKVKDVSEFYDYRGQNDAGFRRKCKACSGGNNDN
jgi:hypothetical protein